MHHIKNFYSSFKATKLLPNLITIETSSTNPEFYVKGKKYLMFCSNNYLGLADHPSVLEAGQKALEKYGMGPGGSRYLCGNLDVIEKLERDIASFVGKEDAITFPTGYMANSAIFLAILDPFLQDQPHKRGSGVLFSDEYNHATIIDGGKLSSSKKEVYKNLDNNDLRNRLESNKGSHPLMVATESVYSMDGNVSNITETVKIAKEYDAIVMVDDAHGIGVLGAEGRGALEHFNVHRDVDILMGTMDKALGAMGGFLAADKDIIDYLRIASRPYIFSSSVPASIAAAVSKAIELCVNDSNLRTSLKVNIKYLRDGLTANGFKILGNYPLPAIPVFIGDEIKAMQFSAKVFAKGIFSPAVYWPAVNKGEARIRVTVMSHHKKEHLDRLIEIYIEVGKEMGII